MEKDGVCDWCLEYYCAFCGQKLMAYQNCACQTGMVVVQPNTVTYCLHCGLAVADPAACTCPGAASRRPVQCRFYGRNLEMGEWCGCLGAVLAKETGWAYV